MSWSELLAQNAQQNVTKEDNVDLSARSAAIERLIKTNGIALCEIGCGKSSFINNFLGVISFQLLGICPQITLESSPHPLFRNNQNRHL